MAKIDRLVSLIKSLNADELSEFVEELQKLGLIPPDFTMVGAFPKGLPPWLKGRAKVKPQSSEKPLDIVGTDLEGNPLIKRQRS